MTTPSSTSAPPPPSTSAAPPPSAAAEPPTDPFHLVPGEVVEIDEVDEKSVAGAIYYITFKAKRAGQELEGVLAEELSNFMAEVFDGVCGKNVRSVWKLDRMTGVIKEGIQEMMKEAAQFSGAAAIDDSASPFDDPSSKYSGKYVLDESVRNMSGEESMKSIGGKTYKPREPLVPNEVIGGILKRRDFKTDPSLYQTLKACATLAIERYNESQLEPECTYQVVEIDEVDEKGVAGAIYYITFKAKRAGQELETVPDEELSTFMAEVFNGIGGKKVHSVWKLDVKTVLATSSPICSYVADQSKWRVNAPSLGMVKYPIMASNFRWPTIPQKVVMMTQLNEENNSIRDNGILPALLNRGDSSAYWDIYDVDPNTPNNGLSHHVELVTGARSDNGVEFLEIQNSHEHTNNIYSVDANTLDNGLSHHAVLVTGAGNDNRVELLEIQDFPGTSWGMQGFGRMKRHMFTSFVWCDYKGPCLDLTGLAFCSW
ncbi:hypothetical protein OROMI_020982 [Orobanche minor]